MLTDYVHAAMQRATYKIFQEDGSYFGEIPGLQGVYANEPTLEACRDELQSVLEDWILFSLSHHLPIPVLEGIDLNLDLTPVYTEDVA
ncbi:MAG: type II toxin-antitoxin system HicB family antitoxin [Thermostichus sp. HHBFW_bins_43]